MMVLAVLAIAMTVTSGLGRTGKNRTILVGDSTVTDNAGWGLGFKQFLNPETTELINTPVAGAVR